jgi:prepilin-type N-terminal cleavage/methylation domain-containing protein
MMPLKRFKDKGFSLAEVMVVSGILAGLALVVMRINEISFTSTKRVEVSSEIVTTMNAIGQYLLDGDACENTFTNSPVDLSSNTSIDSIRNRSNNPVFQVGQVYGNNSIQIESISIRNIALSAVDPVTNEKSGEIDVVFRFASTSQMVSTREVDRAIRLHVRTNSSNLVVKCYGQTASAVGTALQESCQAIDGTFDLGSSRCILPDFRLPILDTPFRAISESYMRDFLNLGTGTAGTLTIGDHSGDMLNIISNVTLNQPIVIREDVTVENDASIYMTSDERLKVNIEELSNVLADLQEIRGVSFNWKESGDKSIGFIAQDILAYYPDIIRQTQSGYLMIDYQSFSAVLFAALKELDQKRKEDSTTLRALEQKILRLEERMNQLSNDD